MKTFTKYLLLPFCCLFMAAGCGKDDLPDGEDNRKDPVRKRVS